LKLKKFFNFTSEVLISKIDYKPKLESKAFIADTSIRFYSPVTGESLPFEKICYNNKINMRFQIKDIKIDKEDYAKYITDGFNIYDSNSQFYNSRCLPLVNNTSEGDITINDRLQKIYKNVSFSCGNKCLFTEIDVNNYTVCNCVPSGNSTAMIEKITFSTFSQYNFEIIVCYQIITMVIFIFTYFF